MINHWTFRCKDVSVLISRSMDDPLPLGTRMGIRFHLMMCRFCRNYQKQLRVIQKILQRLDSQMESDVYSLRLPDEVQKKLKDLLSGHD
ncbi:MAG: zf-HC2 domain-containing protein [Desulfotignum sp.]